MNKGYKICSTCVCKDCNDKCSPCKSCCGLKSEVVLLCNKRFSSSKQIHDSNFESMEKACKPFGPSGTYKIIYLLIKGGIRSTNDVENMINKYNQKPIKRVDSQNYECPSCSNRIKITDNEVLNYCNKCGQKLKTN